MFKDYCNLKVYSCYFAISDFAKSQPLARKRKKNALFLPFPCDFLQIHLQSIAIHCNFAHINKKIKQQNSQNYDKQN